MSTLLFGHKDKHQKELHVDLGDLQNEKEDLIRFLQQTHKIATAQGQSTVVVDAEKVSLQDLQHAVTKFVYHRNLNSTHWVSVEGGTVKINRFKEAPRKTEKNKKEPPHQTAVQSWGL